MEKKEIKKSNPKKLSGVVVSDKPDKTIVVEVKEYVQHPKYKKFMNRSKRYQAHDELNEKKIGDKVTIVEGKPKSKNKHFYVLSN